MKYLKFTLPLIVTIIIPLICQASRHEQSIESGDNITITILYDNYKTSEAFETDWGFSCLIEGFEKTILFDAGGKGKLLLSNMKKLEKDPADVDIVFLSHIHEDHTGGMKDFLDVNHDVTVYLPVSFPDDFKALIRGKGAKISEISESMEIITGVRSTGEMGTEIIEQSLVLKTSGGQVLITGCAHPGIIDIIQKTTEITHDNILLAMGGFHLLRMRTEKIHESIGDFMKLKVKYAAPTHCSGDQTMKLFREKYVNNFIELGAGKILKLNELQ